MSETRPTLREIAKYVPYGFECRSCGGSAYNWLAKCASYVEGHDPCCADFRSWVDQAIARGLTAMQRIEMRREYGPVTAAEAPRWPSGCIKPGSCSRYNTCVYATSSAKCQHYGKDLTREIEGAAPLQPERAA